MLTPAIYMLQLYDRVVTGKSVETLFMITLIVIGIYIFLAIIDYFRHLIAVRLANQFDDMLDSQTFKSLFTWSSKEPTMANSTPLKDIFQIRQFLSSNALLSFFDLPWTIIFIIVLFLFHFYFGLFAIFALIVLALIVYINEKSTKEAQEETNNLHANQMDNVNSYLQNSEVVNSMGILKNINSSYDSNHQLWLESQTKTNDLSILFLNMTKYLRTFFQSIMLGIGAYLVIKMELSPGMMIAGSILLGRVLAPIDILVSQWKQVINSRQALHRLENFLEDTQVDDENRTKLPEAKGQIQVDNIICQVANSKNVILNGLNLDFNSGEITCLLGESGSGKSTLIRAILGLWPLLNGRIRINNADINQWDVDSFNKIIGYLPQNVELFDGTIAQNIAQMGEINDEQLISASKLCDIHELITSLPDGYNTIIGRAGVILSGGQKQRIALARAIYSNPKIVILDEPNSNLDDKGDLALIKTLQRLKSTDCTVIIVTHKMNIVKYVDKVVVLRDGKVFSNLLASEFFSKMKKVGLNG
jgi:ATP-binding cassette subfamily C protein EexD